MSDPVRKGQSPARAENTVAPGEDGPLVGDVQEGLLADAGVEAAIGKGQPLRVTSDSCHDPAEADPPGQPRRGPGPVRAELEGHHPAPAPAGQDAGRPAQTRAEIEGARTGG